MSLSGCRPTSVRSLSSRNLLPAFGPRLLLGAEGARELAEASQYVRPQRLVDAGHHFRHPELAAALRHMLGREPAVVPAIRVPWSR